MSASKFLTWLVLLFACALTIAAGIFYLHLGQPWWPFHHNREVRIAKHHIAESTEGPTIWLQGGSSTWFGFDSPLLASETEFEVVNLAFNVNMPTEFCFNEVKRFARSGDVVILGLENSMYFRDYYSSYAVNELAIWAPEFFWSLSPARKAKYLRYLSWRKVLSGALARLGQATGSFDALLKPLEGDEVIANIEAHWNGAYTGNIPEYYNYLTLNRHGDFEYGGHERWRGEHDYNLMSEQAVSKMMRRDLSEFAEWAQAKDVRVFMSWLPMAINAKLNIDHPIARANLHRMSEFSSSLGIDFLGRPDDFLFEIDEFYDTSHHLTAAGARKRTARMIPSLKSALEIEPKRN